jgi:hypothetical protein
MHKLIFRVASLLAGMVGGLLASAIFKKAWQLTARQDEAPKATDAARGWHEILIAAALQGTRSSPRSRPRWTAPPHTAPTR